LFVNARPGAEHGAFHLVGWRTVKITADMVGMNLAQFAAVKESGRLTADEVNFARQVREAGGFAGVAQRIGGRVAIGEIGEE
jgi:hypothetical protein